MSTWPSRKRTVWKSLKAVTQCLIWWAKNSQWAPYEMNHNFVSAAFSNNTVRSIFFAGNHQEGAAAFSMRSWIMADLNKKLHHCNEQTNQVFISEVASLQSSDSLDGSDENVHNARRRFSENNHSQPARMPVNPDLHKAVMGPSHCCRQRDSASQSWQRKRPNGKATHTKMSSYSPLTGNWLNWDRLFSTWPPQLSVLVLSPLFSAPDGPLMKRVCRSKRLNKNPRYVQLSRKWFSVDANFLDFSVPRHNTCHSPKRKNFTQRLYQPRPAHPRALYGLIGSVSGHYCSDGRLNIIFLVIRLAQPNTGLLARARKIAACHKSLGHCKATTRHYKATVWEFSWPVKAKWKQHALWQTWSAKHKQAIHKECVSLVPLRWTKPLSTIICFPDKESVQYRNTTHKNVLT